MHNYSLRPDGWFENAVCLDIRPRIGKGGATFRPVSRESLHPTIAQRYGAVRACTVHCTDVLGDAAALARATAWSSPRASSYHMLVARDGALYQLAPVHWVLWHAGRSLRTKDRKGYLDVWEDEPKHRLAIESVVRVAGGEIGLIGGTYPRPAPPGSVRGAWCWPVVDGVAVGNPNNWGPGIELMGKPGRPTSAQEDCLAEVLHELYAKTKVTPDAVWPHGAGSPHGCPGLDPLGRHDPGFDVPAFARACALDAHHVREGDGWDAAGEDDDAPPEDPASGIGRQP